jgi:hypothetical protein
MDFFPSLSPYCGLLWCINSLLYQTSFGGQAKQGSGFSRQQINPNSYSFMVQICGQPLV